MPTSVASAVPESSPCALAGLLIPSIEGMFGPDPSASISSQMVSPILPTIGGTCTIG